MPCFGKPAPIYTMSAASIAHQPLPSPVAKVLLKCWDTYNFDNSSDALTDWINARWEKTGYQVSKETVCFTLRMNGHTGARMGLGDKQQGAFMRTKGPSGVPQDAQRQLACIQLR